VDVRMAVVRRRLDYEADPDGFAGRYAEADREIADRILLARDLLGEVELPEGELRRIAALCASFDVDGMRADLVLARTAAAHAAWRSGRAVTEPEGPLRRTRYQRGTARRGHAGGGRGSRSRGTGVGGEHAGKR
jgi:magnesium chelatase subunit D